MEQYIPKSAVLTVIENFLDKGRYHDKYDCAYRDGNNGALYALKNKLNTLEVKEVGVWKTVDNINPPQADRNKIYCVLSKNKYLLARVIEHPQDDDLLQWKCTEFPHHRYDMCEGDKYMQIV